MVSKYRNYCISSKYQQYRTAGTETEIIEYPGIKQLVSDTVVSDTSCSTVVVL